MNDMTGTIAPKSDQINADDLIGRTLTIRVTKVVITGDEQPVAIHFDGDAGKPYKACKSMRRVLVNVWGPDANKYIGRSMTLFRDDKVMFGGVAVGGIRISHMSHIEKPVTMALTATRANRKPFTVKPLVGGEAPKNDGEHKIVAGMNDLIKRLDGASTMGELEAITAQDDFVKRRGWLKEHRPAMSEHLEGALAARLASLEGEWSDDAPEPPPSLEDDGILPPGFGDADND